MDLAKELKHYTAHLDLWWAGIRRSQQQRKQAQNARLDAIRADTEERQRKMAAGELAMPKGWYQHPNDPPGFQRWWDGERWTEHSQQSPVARANVKRQEANSLVVAGWITFALGLFFWPVFLATFVIGIVVAAKGIGGQGALLIIGSLFGPVLSIIGLAALLASGS